ncbi:hypothetical protein L3X38_037403 [Prunus dulcis]|uniref:protein-tyrosine-phosphatase n=1 Tax=Prunus dulcis TaxID=3755 RepID=A0AAD4V4K9_PRUDU|nr:hypothetical protein L3X38_037403 [Prunus dulcis]
MAAKRSHIFSVQFSTKEINKVYAGGSVGGSTSVGDGSKTSLLSDKLSCLLERAGKDLKLERMGVPLRDMDDENLLAYLDVCVDFIDKGRKKGSFLVHCFAGISRRLTAYAISDLGGRMKSRTFGGGDGRRSLG